MGPPPPRTVEPPQLELHDGSVAKAITILHVSGRGLVAASTLCIRVPTAAESSSKHNVIESASASHREAAAVGGSVVKANAILHVAGRVGMHSLHLSAKCGSERRA